MILRPLRATPPRRLPAAAPCFILLAIAALWLATPRSAPAQPPHEIHYQGRLTDNANVPLSGPRFLIFRIFSGGAAGTANSGTELYRESASIVVQTNGTFEYSIGSGTPSIGALDQALFNTASDLFLQIDVGALNNATLPRARFSSVGYSLVAENAVGDISPRTVTIEGYGEVIDENGVWQGEPIPTGIPGGPVVTNIADATGGRLVIGDLLQIDGSALSDVVVYIGDREAPVKSRTPTQVICQIPERTPMGLNSVTLVANPLGGIATTIAHVQVHRLLVAIRSTGSSGVADVIDAFNNEHITQISLGSMDSAFSPVQTAFAHQGALLLVPNAANSTIYCLDLTANPPVLADAETVGSGDAFGIAVNPSGTEAVVCFPGNNRAYSVAIDESAPPYDTPLASNDTQSDALPTGLNPRAALFLNDRTVTLFGQTAALNLLRQPTGFELYDDTEIPGDLESNDRVGGFNSVVSLTPSHDRNRVFVVTQASSNVSVFYPAIFWAQGYTPSAVGSTGLNPLKIALSPDEDLLFAASEATDRLQYYSLVNESIRLVGLVPGPNDGADEAEDFQVVAVEPVTGSTVAVTTNEDRIFLFPRSFGGTVGILDFEDLSDVPQISFSGVDRDTMDLVFQP